MIAETIPALQDLNPKEKLILAQELIDQFEQSEGDPATDDAIEQLVEARLARYLKNPETSIPLEDYLKKTGKGG